MTFELLIFDINKNSQSWFTILNINGWHLLYVEWDYEKEIQLIEVFGFKLS